MSSSTSSSLRLAVSVLLILSLIIIAPKIIRYGIISPGFEGAKCWFYGADFRFNADWQGTYQLHRYQDAEDWLTRSTQAITGQWWDYITWTTVATPNDAAIGYEYATGIISNRKKYPDLGFHVESNIQLEDINRQGDPFHWNDSAPMNGQRIEYWTKNTVKEETDDKVYYHYTVEKESVIVAPAEFWVGFYLVPSQDMAGTGSGWREGEWQNIVVWFMLDWNTWDNAYKDPWLDDPQQNVFDTLYDGAVLNQERLWDYRGGFPITGWIQGWEKAGWTSSGEHQESPQWYETRGKESNTYTIEELAGLKDILMSKVQFAPSLVGQFISLYDSPDAQFSYDLSETDFGAYNLIETLKSPSSEIKETMYFPINIQNFGTYADGSIFSGWRVFYPTCYFRIRMLYGVYGNFTYLWTEELAKDPDVDYPDEPERHDTIVIDVPGAADWWDAFITNPWTWLSILSGLAFTFLIVLAIIAIAVPGGYAAIMGLIGRRRPIDKG